MSLGHGPRLKTACVFCNGQLEDPQRAKQCAADCDILLAADGGSRHLAGLGLTPRVIIGDMDSIPADLWRDENDILRIPHPTEKDKSDAELAVEYAFRHNCEKVVLVAVAGGRLDHTLGNVALAARYPGQVAIIHGRYTVVAVDASRRCRLTGKPGDHVSLVPYSCEMPKVSTTGLKYQLQYEDLSGPTRGLSNEMCSNSASVLVSRGALLVCVENGEAGFES